MAPLVIVDDSAAFNQGAGIGRYARHLLPALVAAMPDARFTLWYAPEPESGARFASEATALLNDAGTVRTRSTRINRGRMDQLWFRARIPLPIECWTGRGDVVYSPDFTAPPAIRTPRVMTIHDLAFEIVPERAPDALRKYLSAVVPREARTAARLIAVSETTKRDIVERLNVSPDRITVIPNAADDRFFQAVPLTAEQRSHLGVPEDYFLIAGTLEPRKNHLTLFQALRAMPEQSRLPLVIAGRIGWAADDIVRQAKALAAEGLVVLLDYVEERSLPGLYAGARALIYPSWYEGFGLPVLEGLAAGIRVIASDVPAHREIAGGCATLAPPGDVEAIADAMTRAAETEDDERERSIRRERAHCYSWDRSGSRLAEVLREVIGS